MRRKILARDLPAEYLAEVGKIYIEQILDDVPVLQALTELGTRAHDVSLLDRSCQLLMLAGVKDEATYIQRMEALLRLGNVNEGRRICREAGNLVTSPAGLAMLHKASSGLGAFDAALHATEQLLEMDRNDARRWSGLGTARQHLGDIQGAEAAYRKALSLDAAMPLTRFLLSACRNYSRDDNNLPDLRRAMGSEPEGSLGWQQLVFAQAKELEDCADYDESFAWYSRGAKSVRKGIEYSTDTDRRICDLLLQLDDLPGSEGASGEKTPVFILGMPRTGSSLLERILSSHSRVVSQGETNALLSSVRQYLGVPQATTLVFQRLLDEAKFMDYGAIGQRYLEYVEPRETECEYFVEKLPQNVFFAGLIPKAFPAAKIIYTDRNPMDACFSNFKQLFNPGFFPYSYDLLETATHYRQVKQFAETWCEHSPERVIISNYDELVANPEAGIDRVLKFLGLETEQACYSPEKNRSGLATASFAQARRPIYRSSSSRWKNYGNQLGFLQSHFEQQGIAIT